MNHVPRPVARLACAAALVSFTAGSASSALAQDLAALNFAPAPIATPAPAPVSGLAPTPVSAPAASEDTAPGPVSASAAAAASAEPQLPGPLRLRPASEPRSEESGAGVFRDLFAPLGGDLVRGFTRPGLMLLGVGAASALSARPADRPVAAFAWPTAANDAFEPGKYAGNSFLQMGGALAAYTVGRASGSARTARVGAMIFRAQVVAEAYTRGLKLATSRTRPDGTSFSFPSGHSAAGFATATVLASEFGAKVGIPAYAAAAWVAASRLEARRHFLSDVVAGAAVGILAGRSITIGSGKTRFAMTPIVPASGSGFGAGFTKITGQ